MAEGIASLPAAPAETPGLPSNFTPFVFEIFETLNTKSLRPGLKDGELFWVDGFIPFGPNNLRTLWGVGPTKYTVSNNAHVLWFGFGNIADTSYGIVVKSDGGVDAFDTSTGIVTSVMAATTIQNPSSVFGFSQWGSQYLIFAKDQTNGYWLWDGTNLFTAGTLGPTSTITNSGSNYTSAPTITLQTTGAGSGAVLTGTVLNGSLVKVTTTTPGSGFAIVDLVVATVQGGGSDDQAVCGTPTVTTTSGGLSGAYITNGGQGYTSRAYVQFTGGGGSGASASLAIQNGVITGAAIVSPGTGYTSLPTVAVIDPGIPGSPPIPGGSGVVGGVTLAFGQITAIPVASGGSGYISPPTVQIIGDGIGATAVANIQGGQVIGIQMTNPGHGYTTALAVLLGGNKAANVTPLLMPFGVSGTTVEVFQSRVWVSNGGAISNTPTKNRTIFSAPSSPVDFGDGGGAFQSFDSFLRVGYHWLKQTNGFLYLGGDSSLNYISGVQTNNPSGATVAAAIITTFSNQNVDPQLGSPWPSSVQVFSRNIVFANSLGIFVSYGGAVTKVSEPLDGFYGTGPIYGNQANFPSAVANIFGIPVYMLLLPVIDPFTQQQVNKLLMWTGRRWFTSQQDRPLSYIASQEINSVLTAWGTDGIDIFPLFQAPSTGLTKVVQSKLFAVPAYYTTKTATRIHGIVNYYQPGSFTVTVDNESGNGTGDASIDVLQPPGQMVWTNNSGNPIVWMNGNTPLVWGGSGLLVFGPYSAGQNGRLTGLTIITQAADMAFLSVTGTGQTVETNL